MPSDHESPADPFRFRRKALLDRVFRLRQHRRSLGNQGVQDALTDVTQQIKSADKDMAFDVIEAGLTHIEKDILDPEF